MFGQPPGHRLGEGGYGRATGGDDEGLEIRCDDACPDANPVLLGGGLACALLVGVLGIMSLGAVPPLFMGIRYNHFTKVADTSTVYEPGRFFIGPFNKFLLFPTDVQTIEFSNVLQIETAGARYEPLHTRTKEGLGLHLQVALQYRLLPEEMGRLYTEFNQNYEQVFTSSVRDVLIKAASEFEATQLWQERERFQQVMQDLVTEQLRKTYAECWGLQLMRIDLPDEFENSTVRTQVQKQMTLINEQAQHSAQIHAETEVIQADYAKRVKILMAQAEANYTLRTKEAMAEAQKLKIEIESIALSTAKSNLGLGADEVVKYLKYGALHDLDGAQLLYGFVDSQARIQVKARGPVDLPGE